MPLPSSKTPPPAIALIGLRGSGKSATAKLLAERISRPFVDLDSLTPTLTGHPDVAAAWAALGQAGFRSAEARALPIAMTPGTVVALGGGTPTAPGAADLLRARRADGSLLVVYLTAPAATLRERLRADAEGRPNRPSLTGADPLDEIDAVLAARDPLYRSLADLTLDVSALPPDLVSDAIISRLAL